MLLLYHFILSMILLSVPKVQSKRMKEFLDINADDVKNCRVCQWQIANADGFPQAIGLLNENGRVSSAQSEVSP